MTNIEYNQEYYQRTKERDREKRAAAKRAWRLANPDKTREHALKHYHAVSKHKRVDARPSIGRLFYAAKHRAKKQGIPFEITMDEIVVPDVCPILGVPMIHGTPTAPSLDKLNPSKGYVTGNVNVISRRANTIKNDGTLAEHQAIVDWMRGKLEAP